MSTTHSEQELGLDVRPKRQTRAPIYLEDYEVEHRSPPYLYPPTASQRSERRRSDPDMPTLTSQHEGDAEMTSLAQWEQRDLWEDTTEDVGDRLGYTAAWHMTHYPSGQGTEHTEYYLPPPTTGAKRDASGAIQQLKEENRLLHQAMMVMRRRMEAVEAAPRQPPVPMPRTRLPPQPSHEPQSMVSPIPTPRSRPALPTPIHHQNIGDEVLRIEHERPRTVASEQNSVANMADDLVRLRLQSTRQPKLEHRPSSRMVCSPEAHSYPTQQCHQGRSLRRPSSPPRRSPSNYRPSSSQRSLSHRRPSSQRSSPRRHHSRDRYHRSPSPPTREKTYRGPRPSIPDFTAEDPRQFARLKIALDNILPHDATERFKYQILSEHLKFEEALLIADSYSHSRYPYTHTMRSLTEHYGQPHQLSLRRIAELMDGPSISSGDTRAFRKFALRVRALVGMLDQQGEKGDIELKCGSHVARLMSKLPHDFKANFRRYVNPLRNPIPTLLDFSAWLEFELQVQVTDTKLSHGEVKDRASQRKEVRREHRPTPRPTTVLLSADEPPRTSAAAAATEPQVTEPVKKVYCQYCDNNQHYLNQCTNFTQLTKELKTTWIKSNRRCWRCGRKHQAAQCKLKATCQTCKGKHLTALHDINSKSTSERNTAVASETQTLYLDRPAGGSKVLLKINKVLLRHGKHSLMTYAILDDGSERTILLHDAAQQLGLGGQPEDLVLRTVRNDTQTLHGARVSFTVSPAVQPSKRFKIQGAFTAEHLGLAKHSHPVAALQMKYSHLRGLPLQALDQVHPLLLIGSDHHHLITPLEPVRFGPPGGPAAIRTRLGWTLQGPASVLKHHLPEEQCLFTALGSPSAQLFQHVERLWQLDTLPYRSEKLVTRSRCDQEAISLLESKTERVEVDGVLRYATPLLRTKGMPHLQAPKDAVLAHLRGTEKRLSRDPERAKAYNSEILKLEQSGYAVKLDHEAVDQSSESWYIPHHMVHHNGKNRIVYNCSFQFRGNNLNECLLPGPTLSPTLLGVLLRFREHAVAITSDIKGMFHQVRLLPKDKPLLRFLWRNMQREAPVNVYEWQVLPFGTTCSPCCATFALQKHVHDHSKPGEDVRTSVEKHFYVDNCLQSVATIDGAKELVNKLQALLATGGFELRQWASNVPSVVSHLPAAARSESNELWLAQNQWNAPESTLGLRWLCQTDTLGYKCRPVEQQVPTMRSIYRILASQYDPLGYIVPYTTRAKMIVQRLWDKHRDWDDPLLPTDLLQEWGTWKEELQHMGKISLPRCYGSSAMDTPACSRDIHVFCDASERAYGSVAYLRMEDAQGHVEVAFLAARSRVSPKRQLSIPRLELCAALTGAQLATVLERELTMDIQQVTLWTDSTTVLAWLKSESCRYKVFVGTRVAEIQELTNLHTWRYVRSEDNPADDVTRGRKLWQLSEQTRWNQGPPFLWQDPAMWPTEPEAAADNTEEEQKPSFCGYTSADHLPPVPDLTKFHSFKELLDATAKELHGAANQTGEPSAQDYQEAEQFLLKQAQATSFPDEVKALVAGKPVPSSSRLITLSPEFNNTSGLIVVGGRLRRSDLLDQEMAHPIVMDPKHPLSQLLIQYFDDELHHPGPERVFAEVRRKYWILRGREAIRHHQRRCTECKKWRGKPEVPKMADLPPARLRLFQPAFYSTGVDCFGPFVIKVGRRSEKRWGIIFKCMTTRGVHIDLLTSIDTDSFLMALRRFIARRGKPHELLSDQGTNFKGGERELSEAFTALQPAVQTHLAKQQIQFRFNPPGAPHFGGTWEREIRSLKEALRVTLGAQTVTEEVLRTVLVEIEGILNSKPLGYVSSDVADADPVTPNSLLMGRPDSSLPQVVYPESEMLSRKRWRHSQVLADHFWSHFVKRYLPGLQARYKWNTDTAKDLQNGAVVMIVDHQLPRALWPVGKVTDTIPGADGRVRTAVVEGQNRTYTRPVSKLIRLPPLPDDDNTP